MSFILIPENQTTIETAYKTLKSSIADIPDDQKISALRGFLVSHQETAEAHTDLAKLLQRSGNSTLALAHFEKACRVDSENADYRKNLAGFYASELGWFEDAVDMYLSILNKNKRDIDAMIAIGRLGASLAGNRTLEAPKGWEGSAGTTPIAVTDSQKSATELYEEGMAQFNSGNATAALDIFKKLISQDPDNALYQNDYALCLYTTGDTTTAVKHYEIAHTLSPANPIFKKNLADICFVETGERDRAVNLYLELHKDYPRDIEVLVNLGHICSKVGQQQEAVLFYRRAIEIEPWNSEACEVLKKLEETATPPFQKKSAQEALSEASKLLESGSIAAALNILKEAVSNYPDNPVLWNDLGVVAGKAGEIETAVNAHNKATALAPANTKFRKNLADLYFVHAGRIDDAIGIYLDLLKKTPRDVEVLYGLGCISSQVGRPDEARTFFRRALEIEPWNTEAREAITALKNS